MNHAKPILVAVDYSECSADALRQAVRIAKANRAKVHALHVVDVPNLQPTPHFLLPYAVPTPEDMASYARSRWDIFAMRAIGTEAVEFEVVTGSPRLVILDRVRQLGPELLVMGAHSVVDARKGVGTTASACVRKAPAKVLLVRRNQPSQFRHVAAAIDFSPVSSLVLQQAARMAAQDNATLHVVHVYDDPWHGMPSADSVVHAKPGFQEKLRHSVEKRLESFCHAQGLDAAALKAQFHGIEHTGEWAGYGRGIIEFSGDRQLDLVVLGTRSSWNIRDVLIGTTAERVVRDAGCSVLAIKPEAQQNRADAV